MAGSMKDIKLRIKSVESTMQITKAMELVASSKMRRAKERVEHSRPYFETLYKTLTEIAAADPRARNPYLRRSEIKRTLLVVIAGDRGLAGGYNANVLKLAAQESGNVEVLPIGKRSAEYFAHHEAELFTQEVLLAADVSVGQCFQLARQITEGYRKGEFDAVKLCYTRFDSMMTQTAVSIEVLPLAMEPTEQQKAAEIELAEAMAAWTAELDASPLTIDVSQIADIVSVTSGVPVSSLTESESRRLLQTESVLTTRNIGHDEAVEAVAKAVRRSRSPLKDPRRPGGSFIFLGPTGTGKTELAKTLAEYLFGSKDALISFDMSEFGSEFEVSKLIGSPPGYVGHDEGGQLTKAVRRHPYSVVLFDEIEKAHPDIFNILQQVLEEGRLTDSQGKTVDFRNTVIIMTSNVGAREIAQDASVGYGTTGEQGLTSSEIRGRAMGELKRLIRPELLHRIDDIVVFQKQSGENQTKIAHLLVDDLRQRLIANGMNIKLTDAAYDKIVAEGSDLTNGARPLRRAILKLIEDPLSEELLAGEWGEGDTVLCDVADGKFVFSHGTGEIPAPRPAGTLGGDTAPAVPHTGNAAPVIGGVTSGPGGLMHAGSGAL